MAYDWEAEAQKEGMSEKIPNGRHDVRIERVVHESRDGGPFFSKGGDPQILIIFQDRLAREVSMMITLSEKASWTLARMLSCCDPPANLRRMHEDGIEPTHFQDPAFAHANLVDRRLQIDVQWQEIDGRKVADVHPVRQRAAEDAPPSNGTAAAPQASPPATRQAAPPPPADDDPPPDEGPPITTKQEAWAAVQAAWAHNTDPNAKSERNKSWHAAVKAVAKPENDFTADDWASVASVASTPF